MVEFFELSHPRKTRQLGRGEHKELKRGDVRWSIKIGWLNLWEQSEMNGAVVVHNPDADHLKPFFGTATPKASRDPHFAKACLGNKELNNGLFCFEHNFPITASFLNPSRVSRARFLQCQTATVVELNPLFAKWNAHSKYIQLYSLIYIIILLYVSF